VKVQFDVDGQPCEARRDSFTGKVELQVGDEVIQLQSPKNLGTHFALFKLRREWHHRIRDHDIVVEWQRPLLLPILRPNSLRVVVDGRLVAEVQAVR
jgi:hypothetical protein